MIHERGILYVCPVKSVVICPVIFRVVIDFKYLLYCMSMGLGLCNSLPIVYSTVCCVRLCVTCNVFVYWQSYINK